MIRYLCLIPGVLLLAAAGSGAEPKKEDAATKDLAKLQGKWKLLEEDRDGTVTKYDDGHVLTIEEKFIVWYDADGKAAIKHSFKLDPSKSPKEIDETVVFNRVFPSANGNKMRCIYQLEGDELKIAIPYAPYRERPKDFTTKEGNCLDGKCFFVNTYKRVRRQRGQRSFPGTTAGAEPEKEGATAKEFARLQGKWRCVETDSDGRVDKGFRNGHVIGFEKEIEISYDAEGQVVARTSIKLDPSKSPKEIDQTTLFLIYYPKEKGKTYRGIYQLEGEELIIALAVAPWRRERPKEFTTKKGSHFTVYTYKRVKP